MGIDLTKMKAKRDALENRDTGKTVFWRPEDGEQTIRILPPSDGDPFKEYWFHYNLGKNAGFLSPKKNFGEDDPLNDFIRQLFKDGSEESVKMAKNLSARQRFFSPVIVRGEEEKGPRLWGFGKMAYKELLNLVLNPEYGDITDVTEGTDLVINYGKPAGAQFPQTTITPRRRPSVLSESEDEIRTWLDGIPDADEVFERKTPEQVQSMLDEFLLGAGDAEETSTEATHYGNSTTQVDKAFEELLGTQRITAGRHGLQVPHFYLILLVICMEVLLHALVTASVFLLGVVAGALIENARMKYLDRLKYLEKTTQEILLPLANKISHIDARQNFRPPVRETWVDYEKLDPDETLELPKEYLEQLNLRGKNGEGKEVR